MHQKPSHDDFFWQVKLHIFGDKMYQASNLIRSCFFFLTNLVILSEAGTNLEGGGGGGRGMGGGGGGSGSWIYCSEAVIAPLVS